MNNVNMVGSEALVCKAPERETLVTLIKDQSTAIANMVGQLETMLSTVTGNAHGSEEPKEPTCLIDGVRQNREWLEKSNELLRILKDEIM